MALHVSPSKHCGVPVLPRQLILARPHRVVVLEEPCVMGPFPDHIGLHYLRFLIDYIYVPFLDFLNKPSPIISIV